MTDTTSPKGESEATSELTDFALEIHARLVDEYGEPTWEADDAEDPVGTLVNTILSQNTNDHNRDIAYRQLRERFPTWEEVRNASTEAIVEAVRPAGLAPTKGPRLQEALETIYERQGEISLAFLRDKPLEEAREWLLSLNGVGPKTAAIVLLFSLGRPAFPVDTHVHRVTQRLGLIPDSASREKAHDLLEEIVPEALFYPFHLNVIRHGRTVCVARGPHCEVCVLQDICAYYQEKRAPQE